MTTTTTRLSLTLLSMKIKARLTMQKESAVTGKRSKTIIVRIRRMKDYMKTHRVLCMFSQSPIIKAGAICQKDLSKSKSTGTAVWFDCYREIDKAQFNTLSKLIDLTEFKRMKPRVPRDLANKLFEPVSVDRKPFMVKKWVSPYDDFKENKKKKARAKK